MDIKLINAYTIAISEKSFVDSIELTKSMSSTIFVPNKFVVRIFVKISFRDMNLSIDISIASIMAIIVIMYTSIM